MFGLGWLALTGVLLVVSLIARDGLLFLIALIILIATLVARYWNRHCLDHVSYQRAFDQRRIDFGDTIELTVEIVNRKLLPLAWLETIDEIPHDLRPEKGTFTPSPKPRRSQLVNLVSLQWYERVRRHYRIRCLVRGEYQFGPVQLRSGDIFGFDERSIELDVTDRVLVYPRIVPIAQLGLPPRDPFGDRRTRDWLLEDPLSIVGVRDYAYGDSPRRIHWKASARSQQLQVKLYEPTTTHRLAIFLNLSTTSTDWWRVGYDPDRLEMAITVAASIANWAVDNDYQVGLSGNGILTRSAEMLRIAPRRDPDQLAHILEALARAMPFASVPFDDILRNESRSIPDRTTVVIVTAQISDAVANELVAMRRAGHRVAVLKVGDASIEHVLRGITIVPIGVDISWRELETIDSGSV